MIFCAVTNSVIKSYFACKQVNLIAEFVNKTTIVVLIILASIFSIYDWYTATTVDSE
jgi:hypothetical protein